jgi:hypothetical protein
VDLALVELPESSSLSGEIPRPFECRSALQLSREIPLPFGVSWSNPCDGLHAAAVARVRGRSGEPTEERRWIVAPGRTTLSREIPLLWARSMPSTAPWDAPRSVRHHLEFRMVKLDRRAVLLFALLNALPCEGAEISESSLRAADADEATATTGNVGIVMGSEVVRPAPGSELAGKFDNRDLVRRFTKVFLFEDRRWRFLAWQASVIESSRN